MDRSPAERYLLRQIDSRRNGDALFPRPRKVNRQGCIDEDVLTVPRQFRAVKLRAERLNVRQHTILVPALHESQEPRQMFPPLLVNGRHAPLRVLGHLHIIRR